MVYSIKSPILILIFLFNLPIFAYSPPQIIISELFRDPFGGESVLGGGLSHEFIELTNISQDTFFIDSTFFTDGNDVDSIIPWKSVISSHEDCIYGKDCLLPGQSALILDPDYSISIANRPSSRFPINPGTLILTVADTDLGNGLQSDDGILLFKGSKNKINKVLFCASDEEWTITIIPDEKIKISSPQNKEGFSIIPTSFLFDKVQFGHCETNITPGFFEGFHNQWYAEYKFGVIDSTAKTISCMIKGICKGRYQKPIITIDLSAGHNEVVHEELPVNGGLFTTTIDLPLSKGDVYLEIDSRSRWLIDCTKYNDSDQSVCISEIYPKAKIGETEWFELVNTSTKNSIDLQHWHFGNSDDSLELIESKFLLGPGEYCVCCKDTNLLKKSYTVGSRILQPSYWHILNNEKDSLLLWTHDNLIVDIASYNSKDFPYWEYQSLERYDSNNSAVLQISPQITPGAPPSRPLIISKKTDIGPIPFTPNNDGKNDLLMISVPGAIGSAVSISIYSFDGRKIKIFKGISQNIYFWDGKKENGTYAPVGPFFCCHRNTFRWKYKNLSQ